LGTTLYDMGDDVEARRVLTQALDGFRAHDVQDPDALGGTLNDLGLVETQLAEYESAEQHIEAAVELWRAAGHRDAVLGLGNLGDVARAKGDLALARQRYEQAITEAEANPTAHALVLPGQYMSLASVQREEGDLSGALATNDRALAQIRALNALHAPRGVAVRSQRARLCGDLGRTNEAVELALAVEEESRAHAILTIQSLPERQALRQVATRSSGLDVLCHEAFGSQLTDDQLRAAYEALLRSRSLVLDEFARRAQHLAAANDPVVAVLLGDLQRSRARLAHLLLDPPADPNDETHQQEVVVAQRQKESLESELAARRPTGSPARAFDAATLAKALARDVVLVSFVRHGESTERYGAFVLAAHSPVPSVVDLGAAEAIDDAIAAWHAQLSETGGAAIPGLAARYRETALTVRERVLDPLEPALGDASRIYVVPDGALHLLNFATLPDGDGYLLDGDRSFCLLSSERDLIENRLVTGRGLLVMGGPDYDGSPADDAIVVASLRGERSSCRSFADRKFNTLPLARAEAEQIASLWGDGAELFVGERAHEGALKRNALGKRALHLSTHGFVLSGACAGGQENPLQLSGLAFAGANRRQEAQTGAEDGILTAEEAASLNLQGVEWVVLSACDTGTGQIADGEGVLGLRRAFEIAGAKSLITSLWPVADDATAEWMRAFYSAHLIEGQSLGESVRSAARELRADPRTAHPFYWGAFVASGASD